MINFVAADLTSTVCSSRYADKPIRADSIATWPPECVGGEGPFFENRNPPEAVGPQIPNILGDPKFAKRPGFESCSFQQNYIRNIRKYIKESTTLIV